MNRKLILSAALSGLMLTATAQTTVAPAIPRDGKIEKKVEALLKKMTLEEKIGQMTELTIDVITKRDNSTQEFQIDDALLDTVIGKYKVGSILNVPQGVAQSKEKWEEIIRKIQDKSMKVMGIPCIYGVDQIHGTTYTLGGTFFPQGINMAATFNRELVREGARISAYETKAGSIPWTYAPVLDLARDARWPRHWENYGEDCYVNAEMGREAVFGFQGSDPNHIGKQQVATCIKHYMGYGVPVSGKDRTPSSITVQDMREKHFAPFLEGIKAGALSVMVNSAMNNGLPFHANYELLSQIDLSKTQFYVSVQEDNSTFSYSEAKSEANYETYDYSITGISIDLNHLDEYLDEYGNLTDEPTVDVTIENKSIDNIDVSFELLFKTGTKPYDIYAESVTAAAGETTIVTVPMPYTVKTTVTETKDEVTGEVIDSEEITSYVLEDGLKYSFQNVTAHRLTDISMNMAKK